MTENAETNETNVALMSAGKLLEFIKKQDEIHKRYMKSLRALLRVREEEQKAQKK